MKSVERANYKRYRPTTYDVDSGAVPDEPMIDSDREPVSTGTGGPTMNDIDSGSFPDEPMVGNILVAFFAPFPGRQYLLFYMVPKHKSNNQDEI